MTAATTETQLPVFSGGTGGTGGTPKQENDFSCSPSENGRGNRGNKLPELAPVESGGVTGVTTLPALDPKDPNDVRTDSEPEEKKERTDSLPEPKIERSQFQTHDGWFRVGDQPMRAGLWWHGLTKPDRTGKQGPLDVWVCSPIHADAITSGEDGADWGLLLRFVDPHGRSKEWAAPLRMLRGSGEELRGELLDRGVRIDPAARDLLGRWMMATYPKRRITAAVRTGWHDGESGRCFVLPRLTILTNDVLFQAEHVHHDDYATAGTLDGWRDRVAAPCEGNPILLLAMSAAFAGPLLKVAKLQEVGGAGLHLIGDSSRGKTTALQAAASVWGGPGFVRTWRATGNGLEATAAALNDTLLVLDEISECDPREVGAIVYCLSNGTGKSRAARTGGTRPTARWRVLALSSGERSLAAHMGEGGARAKAGQAARLLDVPATNRTYGAFDTLHGHADGRAFADALKQAAGAHYGFAGVEFVARLLIHDKRDFPAELAECSARPEFAASDGLESRAAGIFALVGYAGELATEFGLTGWSEGAAASAAAELFGAWRAFRGGGHTETRQITEGVLDFILRHGDARFSPIDSSPPAIPIRDRAGWTRGDPQGRVFLFTSAALQEAAPGHDLRRIAEALDSAGWVIDRDAGSGKRSKRVRIGGSLVRLFAIRATEEES